MDQVKIGKFIATLRKEKNMTQQDLASKLNVTDRAVSHWENGRRLPDYSLLKLLSEVLEVSINEILVGERIDEKSMKQKADENIIKLTETISLKSMKNGLIGMIITFMILVIISGFKNVSTEPLVSMICAYNSVAFISRYKFEKDNTNLYTGVLFIIATILNTLAFILK